LAQACEEHGVPALSLVVALAPYAAPSRAEAVGDPIEQNEQRPDEEIRSLSIEN
jgi:hypothetical protein